MLEENSMGVVWTDGRPECGHQALYFDLATCLLAFARHSLTATTFQGFGKFQNANGFTQKVIHAGSE